MAPTCEVTGRTPEGGRSVLHVLVVEDDADSAASLAQLLRLNGHEVRVAADGPAALQAAQESAPDVVLLDIGLPGMDGCEVARRLAERPAEKRPLFVAVTGHDGEDERRRSEEAGIDLHLVKPADPEALSRLLSRFQSIIGE